MDRESEARWEYSFERSKGERERTDSLLVITAEPQFDRKDQIHRLEVLAALDAVELSAGPFFSSRFRLGCVTVFVSCESTDGRLVDWSRWQAPDGKFFFSERKKDHSSFKPKVIVKHESLQAEAGTLGSKSDHLKTSNFDGPPYTIDSIVKGKRIVKWTIQRNRSPQLSRDYLVGNFHLFSKYANITSAFSIVCRARACDLRIFDLDDKPLGALASLAVRIKAKSRKQHIPKQGEAVLRIIGQDIGTRG